MNAQQVLERHLADFCSRGSRRAAAAAVLRGPGGAAEVNAELQLPAASVAKIAIAMAVFQSARSSRLDLDQEVGRDDLPETRYPSVLAAFERHHRFTLRELTRLSLVTSDNPSATFLLDLVGTRAVNDLLQATGCRDSTVSVAFGDADLGPPNRANLTTAADALALVRRALTTPAFSEVALALSNNLRATRIPLRLPDETRIAHKTGTLEGVVNDVGVVYGERCDLAIAVLTDAEPDGAVTAIEIGDCVAAIWADLGERTA
ncbi:MAG TPA: serine hydrolase [Gaiellaceae bacterium]|nr:serine hydrolase [Gaiellaceae bacterium]